MGFGWPGNPSEIEEYYAMCASVQKYGGFYIARFEAGDGDVTAPRTTVTEAHTVVSKKDTIVYNWVVCYLNDLGYSDSDAVGLAHSMYANSASVVSTLCYAVQLHAALNFVADVDHNITSASWGNYADDSR